MIGYTTGLRRLRSGENQHNKHSSYSRSQSINADNAVASDVFATLIAGLGLIICAFFSSIELFEWASLAILLMWLLRVLIRDPLQVVKFLPFYFAAIGSVLGCAVIEFSDLYLTELLVWSYANGSLPLLVLASWFFLLCLQFFDRQFSYDEHVFILVVDSSRWLVVASAIVAALFAAMFFYVLPRPSFIAGIDRFDYAKTLPPIFTQAWGWAQFLLLFPALSLRSTSKSWGVAAIAFFILTAVWTGEKFGPFLTLLWILMLISYDHLISLDREKLTRLGIIALVLILVLVGAAALLQSFTSGATRTDYLGQRIAQQGQLWWRTYEIGGGQAHFEQLDIEASGILAPADIASNATSRHGIYGIMYLTTPTNVVFNKLTSGSRYSMAGFATAYYCLGTLGPLLFALLNAILTALLMNAVLKSLATKRLLEAIILFRLLDFARGTFSMALLSSFLANGTIVSYAALLLLYLMRNNGSRRGSAHRGEIARNAYPIVPARTLVTLPIDQVFCNSNNEGANSNAAMRLNADRRPRFMGTELILGRR